MARRMPGRPTTKRKKDAVENQNRHTISKVGKKGKCSICKEKGHNKSTCRIGRPEKLNTRKKKKQRTMNQEDVQGNGAADEMDELDEEAQVQLEADQVELDVVYFQVEADEGQNGEVVGDDIQVEADEGQNGEVVGDDIQIEADEGQNGELEVNVQQHELVDLTPPQVDQTPTEVNVQKKEHVTTISHLLKNIRRKKSERILKLKLGKTIGGPDAPGNSLQRAVNLD